MNTLDMKVIINKVKEQTLEEFADEHGLIMEVNERDNETVEFIKKVHGIDDKYYARFKDTLISRPPMLEGTSGNGNTPVEAIRDYKSQISLKILKMQGPGVEDKYIDVPRLI